MHLQSDKRIGGRAYRVAAPAITGSTRSASERAHLAQERNQSSVLSVCAPDWALRSFLITSSGPWNPEARATTVTAEHCSRWVRPKQLSLKGGA
jgi:hypothetical protein